MAELAKQDHSISEDTLHGAFPFIKSRKSGEHGISLSESRQKPLSPLGIPHRTFPSELFQDLTKSEMQRVLEILHYAAEATTGDDVNPATVLESIRKTIVLAPAHPCKLCLTRFGRQRTHTHRHSS